jgi:hypothetical protein
MLTIYYKVIILCDDKNDFHFILKWKKNGKNGKNGIKNKLK